MLLAFFEVNNRNNLHIFQKLIIKGQYIFYLLYVYRMAVDLWVFFRLFTCIKQLNRFSYIEVNTFENLRGNGDKYYTCVLQTAVHLFSLP